MPKRAICKNQGITIMIQDAIFSIHTGPVSALVELMSGVSTHWSELGVHV